MTSKFAVAGIVSSFCFAGLCLAQEGGMPSMQAGDMPKESSTKTMAQGKTTQTTAAKAAPAALSAADKSFIMNAAKGGMMEVEWGKMASQNGQNADVKKFGDRMVADHTKANNELMGLAAKKGVKVKSEKMKGKWTSDKDYMAMMVTDHTKVWNEFQAEAKNGSDPDLKKWAGDTSKTIQAHLKEAKKIQGKLK